MSVFDNYLDAGRTSDSVAQSPTELLKIQLLQKRQEASDAIMRYLERVYAGSVPPAARMIALVQTLFYELEPALRRSLPALEFVDLEESAMSRDGKTCIRVFRRLNVFMDDKNMTRIDTGRRFDTTNMEEENANKGLD